MEHDKPPPCESAFSVCLFLSLIRFLFGCQSQFPLDPIRQNRLIPKWPCTTDHQPLSFHNMTESEERKLDSQKTEITPSFLYYDSPPAPDSMQYSRQFEPRLIHNSNSQSVTLYFFAVVCMLCTILLSIGMVLACLSVHPRVLYVIFVQMPLQRPISSEMRSIMR